MKDLTPKADNTAGSAGQYTAAEFNDAHNELQNAVSGSGQALTAAVADDNRQLAKSIAQGGDLRSVADLGTALIGETVLPDNSAGAITINLPESTGLLPLYDGATVMFTDTPPELYSVNSVTFDALGNTIGPTSQTVEVTSDNLRGGFRWDSANAFWVAFKQSISGTNF